MSNVVPLNPAIDYRARVITALEDALAEVREGNTVCGAAVAMVHSDGRLSVLTTATNMPAALIGAVGYTHGVLINDLSKTAEVTNRAARDPE